MLAIAYQRKPWETIGTSRIWVKAIELIASSGETLEKYLNVEVTELEGVVAGS
jgi:hypothetical protein